VLLVDDEPAVRRAAARILERSGFRVLQAGSGAEALALSDGPISVDVLVSDVLMPSMSGPELAEAFVAHHPGKPVVLMSGFVGSSLDELGLSVQVSLLPKPFTIVTLVDSVTAALASTDAG